MAKISFKIRNYEPADAPALVAMREQSILELGARAYSPAQVAAWAARLEDGVSDLAEGTSVEVTATDGTVMVVRPVS